MREIKFRDIAFKAVMYSRSLDRYFISDALRIDSGLSCLFGFENEGLDELSNRVLCSQKFINEIQEEYWKRDWVHIGNLQFTGLADVNGVEIYEKDLLRYNDNYFKIEYDNGAFWGIPYKCTRSDIKMAKHPLGQILHYVFDDTICEVIGNIYENSELLKDEE